MATPSVTDTAAYSRSLRIFAWISYVRAFWLGSMISILFLKFIGLDDVGISVFQAIMGIAIFCLEVPTGMAADRWGYRASVIASVFFLACALGSFLLALALGTSVIFFVTALCFSLHNSCYSGAGNAYVYTLHEARGDTDGYLAYQSGIASVSRIVGAVAIGLGGFLYELREYLPYLIQTVLVSLSCLLSLRLQSEPRAPGRDTPAPGDRRVLRRFFSRPLFVMLLVFGVIATLPGEYFHHVINQSVLSEAGFSAAGIGLAGMGIYLLSGWLLAYLPRLVARVGDLAALRIVALSIAVIGAGFAWSPPAGVILALSAALYGARGALDLIMDNIMQRSIEGHGSRAALLSVQSMFSSVAVKTLFIGVGAASAGMAYSAVIGWLCLAS